MALLKWQRKLREIKVWAQTHTTCMSGIRAESHVFMPRSWTFPLLHVLENGLACWEVAWGGLLLTLRLEPKGLGARQAGAFQPGPELPLEVESRIYTIFAFSSLCGRQISVPGGVWIPSSLMPWSRRWTASRALFSREEAVESASSVLQWWKPWTDLNFGSDSVHTGVTWPLWVSINQEKIVCTTWPQRSFQL